MIISKAGYDDGIRRSAGVTGVLVDATPDVHARAWRHADVDASAGPTDNAVDEMLNTLAGEMTAR